jgi:PAS domain S-box-containing protein
MSKSFPPDSAPNLSHPDVDSRRAPVGFVSRGGEANQSQQHWAPTLDNMLEGCMVLGRDWTYLYVNEVAARHGQQVRENLLGKTLLEMYPGVEKTTIFEAYRTCMEQRVPQRLEAPFTFSDGTTQWYLFSIEPVPEGIFVLSLDITERVRAEQELKRHRDHLSDMVVERTTALERVSERYRSLFNTMTEGFALHEIVCDDNGTPIDYRFLELNPAFERLTGIDGNTVVGRLVSEVLPEESSDWVNIYGKVALGGEPIRFERPSPTLRRHYEVLAYRPAPRQFAVVFLDITTRKRAERALRALSSSTHAMVRANDESKYLQDVCRIVVEDCEQAMVWIGYAEHDEEKSIRPVAYAGFEQGYLETLGLTWGDGERGRGPTGTSIRTGKPAECKDMQTDRSFQPWREEALKRGYASSICFPLLAAGAAFGAITIYSREPDSFADDERKLLGELADDLSHGIAAIRLRASHARAEQTLRESETKLRAFVDNAPVLMGVVELADDDSDILHVFDNPATSQFFGVEPGATYGRKATELGVSPEIVGRWVQHYRKSQESGRTIQFDDPHQTAQGPQWLSVKVSCIGTVTPGRPLFCYVAEDITERKRMEEALREAKRAAESADRAKGRFLANVSHELRTPMNAILGMTELALAEEVSATVRDYLQTATESARDLLTLLNELLDSSRMEAGKFQLEPAAFDLRNAIDRVIKTLRVRAEDKGLALRCEVAPDVPEHLIGDSARLRQVLINLVGNAIKFTPEGTIEVSVSALPASATQGLADADRHVCVQFVVADTGIGIAQEDQERIFAPFTQADETTVREQMGTGLGLPISQHLARMMGGEVRVQSQLGCGSQFSFSARFEVQPVSQAQSSPPSSRPSSPAPAAAPPRPLRILLAEDSRPNQKLVVGVLSKRGHTVQVASNGREALDMIRQADFDLILMDVMMPAMDGFQATAAIRALPDPSKSNLPIVALTAQAMKGDEQRCLQVGMDCYVSKPIDAKQLVALVERLPRQSRDRSRPCS